jgi:hypothetical protein
MDFLIDDDLRVVAEFMQRNVAAAKLVPVAEAVHALAPLLWGHYSRDDVMPLTLSERAISAGGQRRQSASSE